MDNIEKKGFGPLYDKLAALAESDLYAFHMPGHKRNRQMMDLPPASDIDITEIDGFDNLHRAVGVIDEAQRRAARVCKAVRTWFLVNGSTCGLLSAIFACTKRGGRILMARNCHKAVYNAIELNGLHPVYVYPHVHPEYGIYDGVEAEKIRYLLDKYKDIQAVVITSPTYEGVISDITAIAGIAHEYHVPLIVDEAHGAHLGYSPAFEASAVTCGADLVIQSLHKTLPSMTQTALLHLGREEDAAAELCATPGLNRSTAVGVAPRVDAARVQKFLAIFQSSSPSYMLMAGMDRCMGLLENDGPALFSAYAGRLKQLRQALTEGGSLKHIRLLGADELCRATGSRYDRSKLVLYVSGCRGMGKWLYDALREDYHLQLEMVSADYVLGMTSICDTDEGFARLLTAVRELDERLAEVLAGDSTALPPLLGFMSDAPETPAMSCFEALQKDTELVQRELCGGRISAGYLYIYPPGVPFLVPGEIISGATLHCISRYQGAGLEVLGGTDETLEQLLVLK